MPGDVNSNKGTRFGKFLLPGADITIPTITIVNQEKSLHFFALVIIDKKKLLLTILPK